MWTGGASNRTTTLDYEATEISTELTELHYSFNDLPTCGRQLICNCY